MIDARYEAASRTNQSGGRGWVFCPDPELAHEARQAKTREKWERFGAALYPVAKAWVGLVIVLVSAVALAVWGM